MGQKFTPIEDGSAANQPQKRHKFGRRIVKLTRELTPETQFPVDFALSFYQFSKLIDGYAANRTQRESQMVARVPTFTGPSQGLPGDQVG